MYEESELHFRNAKGLNESGLDTLNQKMTCLFLQIAIK